VQSDYFVKNDIIIIPPSYYAGWVLERKHHLAGRKVGSSISRRFRVIGICSEADVGNQIHTRQDGQTALRPTREEPLVIPITCTITFDMGFVKDSRPIVDGFLVY